MVVDVSSSVCRLNRDHWPKRAQTKNTYLHSSSEVFSEVRVFIWMDRHYFLLLKYYKRSTCYTVYPSFLRNFNFRNVRVHNRILTFYVIFTCLVNNVTFMLNVWLPWILPWDYKKLSDVVMMNAWGYKQTSNLVIFIINLSFFLYYRQKSTFRFDDSFKWFGRGCPSWRYWHL